MARRSRFTLLLLVLAPYLTRCDSAASRAAPDVATGDYTAPPPGPCKDCSAVFYKGFEGSACYRIPSIILTHRGTLLAVAENRKESCGDHDHNHDLVARRSEDGGRTWGPLITIYEGKVEPCPGCAACTSNPNPVEVKLSDGSWAILLHFDTKNSASITSHGLDMQIWSYNDGRTWSNASVLSYPPVANVGGLVGPSVGIQGSSGTIYFSNRKVHDQTGVADHFLYWSEDFGKSWQSSQLYSPNVAADESSIAFLVGPEDERIIMSLRSNGLGKRAQVIWDKNRKPGPVDVKPHLTDPGCQGSIVNQDGVLFLSHAKHKSSRKRMTVQSSHDEGKRWSKGRLVWAGPSAYSQLVPLGEGKLGLLFEAGARQAYQTISFVVLDMSEEANQTMSSDGSGQRTVLI